jgi:hypothetical protein
MRIAPVLVMTFIGAVIVVAIVVAVYWIVVRRWFVRWGATATDLGRTMRGDEVIATPTYSATLAVTIDARPETVWPWLVQMGYRRGGLYSYDWLDRLFGYLDGPSAEVILPQHQNLRVGDEIPIGRGGGFPVRAIESGRALVLAGEGADFAWVWQFGVYPIDAARTRLVSRNTVRTPSSWAAWCLMRVIEPAAFIMTRQMLRGIKRRAERLAADDGSRTAA